MFKRHLMIGALIVPMLLNGCTMTNDISDTSTENNQLEENVQPDSLSDVDIAYAFITQNLELTASNGVSIDVQKGENSIIIVYTYDENLTEIITQYGIAESELFNMADQVAKIGLEIQQRVKDRIGIDINIESKVYDMKGNLYIHILNKELLKLNSIRPSFETKEL